MKASCITNCQILADQPCLQHTSISRNCTMFMLNMTRFITNLQAFSWCNSGTHVCGLWQLKDWQRIVWHAPPLTSNLTYVIAWGNDNTWALPIQLKPKRSAGLVLAILTLVPEMEYQYSQEPIDLYNIDHWFHWTHMQTVLYTRYCRHSAFLCRDVTIIQIQPMSSDHPKHSHFWKLSLPCWAEHSCPRSPPKTKRTMPVVSVLGGLREEE